MPKTNEPCDYTTGDDGQRCGLPVKVRTGKRPLCPGHAAKLPLWPVETAPESAEPYRDREGAYIALAGPGDCPMRFHKVLGVAGGVYQLAPGRFPVDGLALPVGEADMIALKDRCAGTVDGWTSPDTLELGRPHVVQGPDEREGWKAAEPGEVPALDAAGKPLRVLSMGALTKKPQTLIVSHIPNDPRIGKWAVIPGCGKPDKFEKIAAVERPEFFRGELAFRLGDGKHGWSWIDARVEVVGTPEAKADPIGTCAACFGGVLSPALAGCTLPEVHDQAAAVPEPIPEPASAAQERPALVLEG